MLKLCQKATTGRVTAHFCDYKKIRDGHPFWLKGDRRFKKRGEDHPRAAHDECDV
ncbi:MAG: hypothetical protein IJO58_04915 [Clostridia bacterium]|nr:hypothetical protein [Clostridia bacterium]MBQ9958370.1 hypothetical protein [Clostridia bacterium]